MGTLARQREDKAIAMRAAGASYADIGRELNLAGSSGAYKTVERGLQRIGEKEFEGVEAVRTLALARLDDLLYALYPAALLGDLRAIDRILGIEVQRAKLCGLYAPVRHELTGKGGGPVQIDVAQARETLAARLDDLAGRRLELVADTSKAKTNGKKAS